VEIGGTRGSGETPLIEAILHNKKIDIIAALLDAGANTMTRDSKGRTAFDYARDSEALQGTDVYLRLSAEQE
jgi:ankyrin repeat protein